MDKVLGRLISLMCVVSGQQPSVHLPVKFLASPSECEGDMLGRTRAFVVILLGGLTLAACGSVGTLPGDAAPACVEDMYVVLR